MSGSYEETKRASVDQEAVAAAAEPTQNEVDDREVGGAGAVVAPTVAPPQDSVADVGQPVINFVRSLERHCRTCEADGKYEEAEATYKRWDDLWVNEEKRRKEALRSTQLADRLEMEEAHAVEYARLDASCRQQLEAYNAKADELMETMRFRHEQEMVELLSAEHAGGGGSVDVGRVKYSKEVLNMRTIQEKLARQRDYAGAMKMKARCEAIEAKEREAAAAKVRESIKSKEDRLRKKHSLERAALERRVSLGLEEHARGFSRSHEHLALRYGNATRSMMRQQQKQRAQLERSLMVALGTRPALRRSSADGDDGGACRVSGFDTIGSKPGQALDAGTMASNDRFAGTQDGVSDPYHIPNPGRTELSRGKSARTASTHASERPRTAPAVAERPKTSRGRPTISGKPINVTKAAAAASRSMRERPSTASSIHTAATSFSRMRSIYNSGFKQRADAGAAMSSHHGRRVMCQPPWTAAHGLS